MFQRTEGGCLCSAIRYRVLGTPVAQSLCHCRSCRLASVAPSVAWIVVRRSDFEVASGTPHSFRSSPHVVRTFCGTCGTSLTYQHDESPDTIDIAVATLDQPDRYAPTREIWIEHKIAWENLDPALRHYPRSSQEDDR